MSEEICLSCECAYTWDAENDDGICDDCRHQRAQDEEETQGMHHARYQAELDDKRQRQYAEAREREREAHSFIEAQNARHRADNADFERRWRLN